MANGFEEHDNSRLAPIAKAFKDLRVETHTKVKDLVMDTGVSKNTICAFSNHNRPIQIDTLMRLLDYMNVDLFELVAIASVLSTDEMRQIIDKIEIRRNQEAENKDRIPPERVRDKVTHGHK